MKRFAVVLFAASSLFLIGCSAHKICGPKEHGLKNQNMTYLDNGIIRLGANLDLGGAITYLADSKKRINIVNNYDWGRQIQMSFYSGPNPYKPDGKQPAKEWEGLGWNPIQSGDFYGNKSKMLEYKNDGKRLYVKCIPMHWPLNNEPGECTFETWAELKGNAVYVRSRINNNRPDHTQYSAHGQEMPAVYTNGKWWRLFTYDGNKPFTGDKLTQNKKTWGPDLTPPADGPWHSWRATENWAALVDNNDWGLGVWAPGTYPFIGGFFGKTDTGGTKDLSCGYIGPTGSEILDYNIQFEYRYVLILGNLNEIRQYVYDHSKNNILPDYRFSKDRQHWYYAGAKDSGWPIKGCLDVIFDGNKPQLISPPAFWQSADVTEIYVKAAFNTGDTHARLYWNTFSDKAFSREKSITFTVVPDGKFHTYRLNLSACPAYKGIVTGLRLDPVEAGKKGEWAKIKSISYKD